MTDVTILTTEDSPDETGAVSDETLATAELEAETVAEVSSDAVAIAEIEANKEIVLAEIEAETALAHIEVQAAALEESISNEEREQWQRNFEAQELRMAALEERLSSILSRLPPTQQPTSQPENASLEAMPESQGVETPPLPVPEPAKKPRKSRWI